MRCDGFDRVIKRHERGDAVVIKQRVVIRSGVYVVLQQQAASYDECGGREDEALGTSY